MYQVGLDGCDYAGNLALWGSLSWVSLNKTKLAAVFLEPPHLGHAFLSAHSAWKPYSRHARRLVPCSRGSLTV